MVRDSHKLLDFLMFPVWAASSPPKECLPASARAIPAGRRADHCCLRRARWNCSISA